MSGRDCVLPRRRHVILASLGTDGDILPYVGLGIALRRRGHDATLVAAEDYRERAAAAGLGFAPLASKEENHQLLADPDFWHVLKGPLVGARWGREKLPRHYELFSGFGRDPDSVFVASPALLAARVVQERLGRALAAPSPQPWVIQNSPPPPGMPRGAAPPRWG